jgi:hypothetical protein
MSESLKRFIMIQVGTMIKELLAILNIEIRGHEQTIEMETRGWKMNRQEIEMEKRGWKMKVIIQS